MVGAPNNAEGTDNWRGGMTWVGERGPELVNLPKGAQVIPNDRAMSGGSIRLGAIHIDARGTNLTEGQMLAIVRQSQAETVRYVKDNMGALVGSARSRTALR
jgi:phage-related protein